MGKKTYTIADLPKADLVKICKTFIDLHKKHRGVELLPQRDIARLIYISRANCAVEMADQAINAQESAQKIRSRKKRDSAMAAANSKYLRAEKLWNSAMAIKEEFGFQDSTGAEDDCANNSKGGVTDGC